MKIYHNPRCSKSREVLGLIQAAGFEPTVVEYLKTPLDRAEIQKLVNLLKMRPRDILRLKDLGDEVLNPDDDDAVLALLTTWPELMERPIVVLGTRAVLARPPEKVLELL